jgi:hypothetical protein
MNQAVTLNIEGRTWRGGLLEQEERFSTAAAVGNVRKSLAQTLD